MLMMKERVHYVIGVSEPTGNARALANVVVDRRFERGWQVHDGRSWRVSFPCAAAEEIIPLHETEIDKI
jgi:hypothetical protein